MVENKEYMTEEENRKVRVCFISVTRQKARKQGGTMRTHTFLFAVIVFETVSLYYIALAVLEFAR